MQETKEPAGSGLDGRRWPSPAIRFEGRCLAQPEVVYDLLADLRSHLEWAGARQAKITRLLSLEGPQGPAMVGTEFHTTGTDGKVARWSDRSVVTEATRPEVFEFVTEGVRDNGAGKPPWNATMVHRYEISPNGGGCRVIYAEDITRFEGVPWMITAPVVSRLVWKMSAKMMRRGFDALLALAEERSGIR